MKTLKQGDIYFADLNPVKGHEQSGLRPVMILQNNLLCKNLSTVIVAPLTTNLKARGYFTTFFIESNLSKLPHDSVVLLFHARAIDKGRLIKFVNNVPDSIFKKVKRQFGLIF